MTHEAYPQITLDNGDQFQIEDGQAYIVWWKYDVSLRFDSYHIVCLDWEEAIEKRNAMLSMPEDEGLFEVFIEILVPVGTVGEGT